MSTHLVLFNRDLRVHDHPALHAAAGGGGMVVPVFVLDESILASPFAAPNRLAFLLDSLVALRSALRALGSELLVRRGDPGQVVADILRQSSATTLHLSDDVSAYATRRGNALARVAADLDVQVVRHPGNVVVAPGEIRPAGGDHFKVFTPYWRRWLQTQSRPPVAMPGSLGPPPGLVPGVIPEVGDLVAEAPSPGLLAGGEAAGRARLDDWLDRRVAGYEAGRDVLADDATSRLSADLHFGTVSAAEIVDRIDRRRAGHEAFLRQLCWRDFNHQLLAANPDLPRRDYRPRQDRWRDDDGAFAAWADGRTGVPIIDAGMRQLRAEGWMHGRARLLTASYLTKHLGIDWRRGAAHFAHWLIDGDLANNWANWQWVAGTGTDTRPNRMFNPVAQARRYDPDGRFVRRWVPEIAHLPDDLVHEPHMASDAVRGAGRPYPPPLVEHAEARVAFLERRGA